MGGILYRLKAWWDAADRSQKVVTVGGAAFLIVLLGATFTFATKPKFVMLYGGLSDSDKSAIVAELQQRGIEVKYDTPGVVEVPSEKQAEARMAVASTGRAPKGAHMGIEGLEKMNLMTTPAQERERLKAMLEGELARSIETYENVQAARVHITLGDDSPFVQEKNNATASVSIVEGPGANIGGEQGRAIASLIAGAVAGMQTKNVTVLNQRMEFLFNGQDAEARGTSAETKIEMEEAVARKRQGELQRTLDDVFGTGATKVSVKCEIDLDSQTQTAVMHEKAGPVEKQEIVEQMPVGSASLGNGAPASPDGPALQQSGSYTNESKAETNIYNETRTQTEKAKGTLKSLVINVLANTEKFAEAPQKEGLESFLAQEVANKQNDPNFPAPTVQYVKFDTSASTAAAKAGAEAASAARLQQLFSLLPIAALLIVGFMVIKTLGKMSKSMPVPVAALGGGGDHPVLQGPVLNQATTLLAAIEGASEGVAAGKHQQFVPQDEDEEILVNSIKGKVHVPLEQIKKTAAERPHVVAMLIKSMLLEDRR